MSACLGLRASQDLGMAGDSIPPPITAAYSIADGSGMDGSFWEDGAAPLDDIWKPIMFLKKREEGEGTTLPAVTYVQPPARRPASLDICTENLGSETGSDDFSVYCPSSEPNSDADDYSEEHRFRGGESEHRPLAARVGEGARAVMYRKPPPPKRSFPPPIPTLTHHMRSRRCNERLVLDAVSVPSQNCFRASRRDGRLILSMERAPSSSPDEQSSEDFIEKRLDFGEAQGSRAAAKDDKSEEEEELDWGNGVESEMGIPTKPQMCLVDSVTPNWAKVFNQVMLEEDTEAKAEDPPAKSLHPLCRVPRLILTPPAAAIAAAAAAALDPYAYCRWDKSVVTSMAVLTPLAKLLQPQQRRPNNESLVLSQNSVSAEGRSGLLVLKRGEAEYSVPPPRGGCKEVPATRRSVLIWKPYSIAGKS